MKEKSPSLPLKTHRVLQSPFSKKEEGESKIISFSLESSAKVFFYPTPHFQSFFCCCLVGVGSADDPVGKAGLAHFVEHMLFQGNAHFANHLAIFRYLDSLASEVNAATSHNQTSYWMEGANLHWKENIKTLTQLLFFPTFEPLEKEKSVVHQEIQSELNYEGEITNSEDWIYSLLWPDQPLGQPIFGDVKSVASFQKEELIGFHSQFYHPANCTFGVVGNINQKELKEHLNALIPAKKKEQNLKFLRKKQRVTQALHLEKKVGYDSATVICHRAYSLEGANKKTKIEVEILANLLESGFSSYLVRNLREDLGLVYEISTSTFFYEDYAILSIRGETAAENYQSYQKNLNLLLENLTRTNFLDWELEILKKKKKLAQETLQENPKFYLLNVLEENFSDHFTFEEFLSLLLSSKSEDFAPLLQSIFSSKPKVELVLAAKEALKKWAQEEKKQKGKKEK